MVENDRPVQVIEFRVGVTGTGSVERLTGVTILGENKGVLVSTIKHAITPTKRGYETLTFSFKGVKKNPDGTISPGWRSSDEMDLYELMMEDRTEALNFHEKAIDEVAKALVSRDSFE